VSIDQIFEIPIAILLGALAGLEGRLLGKAGAVSSCALMALSGLFGSMGVVAAFCRAPDFGLALGLGLAMVFLGVAAFARVNDLPWRRGDGAFDPLGASGALAMGAATGLGQWRWVVLILLAMIATAMFAPRRRILP